ncbi:DUF4304 domain-containing protein [Stratiformator vulcanicus]|nr:DUF4304 domain-containing protein [Stratiformator vulcanicus]
MSDLKPVFAAAGPMLKELGFRKFGPTYTREYAESIQVVNFQKSHGGEKFFINIGARPKFLKLHGGVFPDPKKLKEYECCFRSRVDVRDEPGGAGFSYTEDPEWLADLADSLANAIEDELNLVSEYPGLVTRITLKEFKAQDETPILGGTRAINLRLFADIAFELGMLRRAKSFARESLKRCPPRANSLKYDLESLLQSIDSRQAERA